MLSRCLRWSLWNWLLKFSCKRTSLHVLERLIYLIEELHAIHELIQSVNGSLHLLILLPWQWLVFYKWLRLHLLSHIRLLLWYE